MVRDLFPKILFLADEIPQSKNAGSIQFLRIFKDYPPDRLLVVGRKPNSEAVTLPCRYVELVFKIQDRIRLSRFNRFLADAEAMKILSYRLPKSIQKEVDDFNPDVVITLMQLFMYYQTAYHYAVSNRKHLVIFCHDDVESFSRVHEKLKGLLIKVNAAIYRYAKLRLCISPEMMSAWEIKYGASGEVMYPVPGQDVTPRLIEESKRLKVPGRLTLGFAGSMAYGYAEGMRELIPVLEKSNSLLRIYNSPNSTLTSAASKHIEFCGYAATPNETWERIKEECDAVILPYSSSLRFKDLYSTHFPSKLSEYLSLGMPVIVVGPDYATGVKWSKQNDAAIMVKENEDMNGIIASLISNPESLSHFAEQATLSGSKYFSSEKIISDFERRLCSIGHFPDDKRSERQNVD